MCNCVIRGSMSDCVISEGIYDCVISEKRFMFEGFGIFHEIRIKNKSGYM